MAKQNVYTVAQVNAYIKNMFTQDYMLRSVTIKGEVSNCKYHTSGHIYFTLKDSFGTIACIMFAGSRTGLNFRLTEGQQVLACGSVDLYERDGKYQLYAKEIILDGVGQLYEKYERLKRELEEKGMFSSEYKRSVPEYIKTLGIVTAPTGAAVRDIIQITKRRNPYVQIILYPAIVQGEQAAQSIVKGIRSLEKQNVDVMIVGRGGGSIEDLWAFNEEEVAQAVFDSKVPIISAVGHETDTTIVDYVADLRAPTPSAAAELAVYEFSACMERLSGYVYVLNKRMLESLRKAASLTREYQLRLERLSPVSRLREKRMLASIMEERLQAAMQQNLERSRHRLAMYLLRLKGNSPLERLGQGFSYVSSLEGRTIYDIKNVSVGQIVNINVKNGHYHAKVLEKWEE